MNHAVHTPAFGAGATVNALGISHPYIFNLALKVCTLFNAHNAAGGCHYGHRSRRICQPFRLSSDCANECDLARI
uniref:SFRICE_023681 n=1 Tax=Spodoptera frugiperda TaxID=7108 RepID=A0A2H1WSV5_SPOFR